MEIICLSDELVGEMLKASLFAVGLLDPRTSLCVTFSLWVCIQDKVYVLPLPANIDDMKDQMTVIIMVDHNILRRL